MTLDQLLLVVEEAALHLVRHGTRPYPFTVVVPLEGSTKVMSIAGFPDDDAERSEALSVFAARHLVPANAACFGALAEAIGPRGEDLLMAAYGARRRGSFVTAATLGQGGLGEFATPEPLDPAAMPFLRPLQHAVDLAEQPSTPPGGGLPIVGP